MTVPALWGASCLLTRRGEEEGRVVGSSTLSRSRTWVVKSWFPTWPRLRRAGLRSNGSVASLPFNPQTAENRTLRHFGPSVISTEGRNLEIPHIRSG
jgi:hypothetical protein